MANFLLKFDSAPNFAARDVQIRDQAELERQLQTLLQRREGSALLLQDNQQGLFFGVEGELAFVQYDPRSSARPYLWARVDPVGQVNDFLEFNVGGTSTEIPRRRCIGVQMLIEIVLCFYATGELSPRATWEPEAAGAESS